MGFFQTVKKSVYDVAFYATAKTESFSVALKQYTLFILCVAVVISIPLYIAFGVWHSQVKEMGDIRAKVLAVYPDELVLTFQNGQMASNVEEPYSIPMPAEFDVKTPKNLVVINTRGSITLNDFERYDTLAILGGDAVWTHDPQKDKIEIQKFDQFSKASFVLNEQKLTEWVDLAFKVGRIVVIILLIFMPAFIFVFLWVGYLVYLLFGAFVIWLMAKLRKVDCTYGQSYKLGLYLLTLPILYSVLTTGPLSMFHIPFGFTLILAVLAYANLGPIKTVKTTSVSPAPNNMPVSAKGSESVEGIKVGDSESNKDGKL
ncbi:MAG: hypothetical protein A3J06_04230 [Candidatus Moranbacteria bacterium RIFCSPLOWO2_02_FULL_48_19]|nr:MAG: hypothetical protein A3J06_04230 [Candidatus Moranbacteria bacterium RIFCSPLOWO2_02_FULL_48_19]OGI31476.1 MAG: hypothetical protein A3G09_03725 [Candidatus Moranbacteria bacterium RIFCSPLOWO2_12_FULL_48_12]